MKSITDATWKDAAVIEVRSLLARLEGIAGKCSANPASMLTAPVKQTELESVARQAAKLADLIDRIVEAPAPAKRKAATSAVVAKLRETLRAGEERQGRADRGGEDPPYWAGFYHAIARQAIEELETRAAARRGRS
jgi:hypothetical protein